MADMTVPHEHERVKNLFSFWLKIANALSELMKEMPII